MAEFASRDSRVRWSRAREPKTLRRTLAVSGCLVGAEELSAIIALVSALASAVAAGFAAWTAFLMRRQIKYSAGAEVMDRFNEMNDRFCRSIGTPQDGIPVDVRQAAVDLLSIYERCFDAHRARVIDLAQWTALTAGLTYWVRHPEFKSACGVLLDAEDSWQPGFVSFLREQLNRPPFKQELLR